ncbi:Uncharacterized protein HZ326_10971 [Fusarium oxysporum f. sp. albedinis]|nr:Uncharacterized protein HZ326_10971 [Fusarium oxysporum f. sp. albedinis]
MSAAHTAKHNPQPTPKHKDPNSVTSSHINSLPIFRFISARDQKVSDPTALSEEILDEPADSSFVKP